MGRSKLLLYTNLFMRIFMLLVFFLSLFFLDGGDKIDNCQNVSPAAFRYTLRHLTLSCLNLTFPLPLQAYSLYSSWPRCWNRHLPTPPQSMSRLSSTERDTQLLALSQILKRMEVTWCHWIKTKLFPLIGYVIPDTKAVTKYSPCCPQ